MKISTQIEISSFLKTRAAELGFEKIGIAKAEKLENEAPLLEKWLKNGMHGKMSWMENHFDLRLDPTLLVPGAKSVVVFMSNYYPEKEIPSNAPVKIARYAYGKDYHKVLKKKLKTLLNELQAKYGQINGRAFVDSGPVMERSWAKKAGLGWTGKNSLLLHKGLGSYFFLAELILDIELIPDSPVTDHCGTCTACIDACPTEAIPINGVVDASKCISYLTIELKESIPSSIREKWTDWAFGCDICQEVCPWNRFAKANTEPSFQPNNYLFELSKKDWTEMTEEVFEKVFEGTPVKRAGYQKFINTLESAPKEI